jgi:hypothetical protein
MEFEFDKEMDSLLRQTAKGGNVFAAENPNSEHIDADEISMFAENALPEKVKPYFLKHLADCGRCRTILSNTILLNSEAETENATSISVEETKAETVAVSSEIPWYKNFFSTKNLAFGMGALALIFAVGIGFLVVRNANESMTSEVAQENTNINIATADKPSSDEMSESSEADLANSNATSMDANLSNVESNTETATTSPNQTSENKQSANNEPEKDASGNIAETSERKDEKRDAPKAKTPPIDTENVTADISSQEKTQTDDEGRNRSQNDGIARKQSAPPPPPMMTRRSEPMPQESAKKRESEDDQSSNSMMSAPSRKINGKTFNRKNGVWYDSAYKSQATTNVRRGTSQYKNLDSGLRSIGNQLDGTVVVVWKEKAYRIQ